MVPPTAMTEDENKLFLRLKGSKKTAPMTRAQVKFLGRVIEGKTWSDSIIERAMEASDCLEVTILLRSLLSSGSLTESARFVMRDFEVRLLAAS